VLQRVAAHHVGRACASLATPLRRCAPESHRNTLQHTATHCNTLQHTATHRSGVANALATPLRRCAPEFALIS